MLNYLLCQLTAVQAVGAMLAVHVGCCGTFELYNK